MFARLEDMGFFFPPASDTSGSAHLGQKENKKHTELTVSYLYLKQSRPSRVSFVVQSN